MIPIRLFWWYQYIDSIPRSRVRMRPYLTMSNVTYWTNLIVMRKKRTRNRASHGWWDI